MWWRELCRKSKSHADKADLIIYGIDASTELDENDHEILSLIKGNLHHIK